MEFFDKHSDKIQVLPESGCWIWMASLGTSGYGQVYNGKRSPAGNKMPEGAHRVSFSEAFGPIPDGLSVLHRCDVRCCVNPNHLFTGTQKQNLRDMRRKGRGPLGESHGRSKLTEDQVIRILEMCRKGETYAKVSKIFKVCPQTIANIHQGKNWKVAQQQRDGILPPFA